MPTISKTTLQKHKIKPLKRKCLIKQLMWQKDDYHPTLWTLLQGVLKGANYFDCYELLSIIAVTLLCCNYLPLLQLSLSDHLLKNKKIDNYNMIQLKCEIKFQNITIHYIKRQINTNRVYLPWTIYFLYLHTFFKYVLISKSCQASLKHPQHHEEISSKLLSKQTNINKNGPNPKRFTSTYGSSSSSRRFSHLILNFLTFIFKFNPPTYLLK